MIERRFPFSAAFFTVAMGCSLIACSSTSTPSTTEDTGTPDEDTGGTVDSSVADSGSDAGGDTSKPDTSTDTGAPDGDSTSSDTPTEVSDAPTDTGSDICTTVGASQTGDCGKCGKRERLCGTDKKWLPWGACSGQTGVCVPLETRGVKCGKCGTRTDTCNATCDWDNGVCAGEGYCNEGDVEIQYACSLPKQVKVRTCTDKCVWSDWSACGPTKGWDTMADAPTSFAGRYGATGVWTGTEAIIYGGNCSGAYCADAASYKVSTDTWTSLPSSPVGGRYWHTAVWTGTEMIVWGGNMSGTYTNTGASYNPGTGVWSTLTTTGAPAGRAFHSAVWTGTEMIIWGGATNGGPTYGLNTGGAYNPTTKVWRTIGTTTLAARSGHAAVWTGTKMIVFGGQNTSSTAVSDAASYTPATDSWATLTAPSIDGRFQPLVAASGSTGSTFTFFSGSSNIASPSYYARGDGATFDPVAGSWAAISAPSTTALPNPTRYLGSVWFGGGKLYEWGGTYYGAPTPFSMASYYSYAQATGAMYDPASSTWTALSTSGAPAARYAHTTVWTGAEAIIWGGYTPSATYLKDGKMFRP